MKSDNKEKYEKADIMSSNTAKVDKIDIEVQQKQENGPDKSEKIIKDEDKVEKLNADKSYKNNEKATEMGKPEKSNQDVKKEEEKNDEERGGKATAKFPTDGNKTMPSFESKSKVGRTHSDC